jgi:uncharacterized protein YkwD
MQIQKLFQFWLLSFIFFHSFVLVDYWLDGQLWWNQYSFFVYFFSLMAWLISFIVLICQLLLQHQLRRQWPIFLQLVLSTLLSSVLVSYLWRAPAPNIDRAALEQVVERLGAPAISVSDLAADEQIILEASQSAVQSDISPFPPVSVTSAAPSPVISDEYAQDQVLKDVAWGEAVKVSETGYRMKIGFDTQMGTADEIYQALNIYRYTKGKSNLTWDGRLAKYALERAEYICVNGSDGHAGFNQYVEQEEGYKALGFYKLGENMSTHMRLTGVHLIEWMYAASPTHDANQLGAWSHVGVGVFKDCSVLIFADWMI